MKTGGKLGISWPVVDTVGQLEETLRILWKSEGEMGASGKTDSALGLHAHDFLAMRTDPTFLPSKLCLHFLYLEFPLPWFYPLKCCVFCRAHGNADIEVVCA